MVEPNENPNQSPEKEQLLQQIINEMIRKTPAQLRQEFDGIQVNDAPDLEAEIEGNPDAYIVNRDIPENIRTNGNPLNQQLTDMQRVLIQTFDAIKHPQGARIAISNEALPIIEVLAQKIDVHQITDQNAIFLNRIVRLALDNQLNNLDNLLIAFNASMPLKYIEGGSDIYQTISYALQAKARRLNLTEDQINQLKTESQLEFELSSRKKTVLQNDLKEHLIRLQRQATGQNGIITGIRVEDLNRTRVEADIIRDVETQYPRETEVFRQGEVQRRKEQKINEIKHDLGRRLGLIINARDEHIDPNLPDEEYRKVKLDLTEKPLTSGDIDVSYRNFTELVNYLVGTGVLREDISAQLDLLGKQYLDAGKNYIGVLQSQASEGRSLEMTAKNYASAVYKDEDYELIGALEDTLKFKNYLKTHNLMINGEIDWENVSEKISGLFEKLFEIAEAQPKLFWQESFYELTEGQVYKGLVGALRKLGRSLNTEGGDPELAKKEVFVWDYYTKTEMLSDPKLQRMPPSRHLIGKRLLRVGIGEALESILANQMVDFKDFTEYAHNVQVITDQGMGFDKLAEYAAKLRLRDVMKVIASKKGLADVYSMLLQNMDMELSTHNHIFRQDFGMRDNYGYDRTEWITAQQTAVDMSVNTGKLIGPDDPNIRRLIRLAGGITKGVTGEFWGSAWTADLPNAVEQVRINELGENIDGVYEYLLSRTYMSLSNAGVEKMMPSIDLWKTLKRFGLPRLWQEFMSLYVPRDFNKSPDMIKKHVHGKVYKLHKLKETAKFMGRTDELAKIDDLIIFAEEVTKTSSIDYMKRGGWRFYQYRNFLVYQQDENGNLITDRASGKFVLDFKATIRQLSGAGPYLVRSFFTDLVSHEKVEFQADVSDLSFEGLARQVITPGSEEETAMRRINRSWTIDSDLNDEQKKELQRILYRHYVFEPLAKTHPTHYFVMEDRRWTPQDEVMGGRLLSDRLIDKLSQIYEGKYKREYIIDHILPLYVGAVQLAEKDRWDRAKLIWKDNRNKGRYWEPDPFDYRFDENVFDFGNLNNPQKRAIRDKMIQFFHLRKEYAGYIREPGDKDYVKIDDQEFLQNLKIFTRTMTDAMSEDKWSRCAHVNDPNSKNYNKETMSQRYARLLVAGMGNVDDYLKGNLLDLREIDMHQAGSRPPERMFGETATIQKGVTGELVSILSTKISNLVSHKYPDIHTWEKTVANELGEPFSKIKSAIEMIDLGAAHDFGKKWITLTALAIEQDWFWRYKGMGAVLDWYRRRHGTPGSYMQGKIPHSAVEPSTAANSEQIERMVRVLGEAIQLPRDKEKVIDMVRPKIFGIEYGNPTIPVYDHKNPNPHSTNQLVEALGVTREQQILENIPGGFVFVSVIILLLLLKQALDKNKESSRGR